MAIIILALLSAVVLVYPYALSVYHHEIGCRALDRALAPVFTYRLAPEQVVDAEALRIGVQHLQVAIEYDPHSVQSMRAMARALVSGGNLEEALQLLQHALTLRPDNPLILLEIGDIYDSIGQTEAAISAYESGHIGSRTAPLTANYLKLADIQAEWGSGDYAIYLWRRALEIEPNNIYALHRLTMMYTAMDDEERAADYVYQLQHMEPYSVTIPLDPRLALRQGLTMVELVENDTWERDTLLTVISQQLGCATTALQLQMVEQILAAILERWPGDPELNLYLNELGRIQEIGEPHVKQLDHPRSSFRAERVL